MGTVRFHTSLLLTNLGIDYVVVSWNSGASVASAKMNTSICHSFAESKRNKTLNKLYRHLEAIRKLFVLFFVHGNHKSASDYVVYCVVYSCDYVALS